ncbi:MAG TPA: hypothetical protein VG708_03080 [Mycobacteriales bacterium]|nr:hypothetical protein [Mycobacteriales bacterium]
MTVLLLGFDPRSVPGVDASMVETAIAIGQQRFDDLGIETVTCLVKPDATADGQIIDALRDRDYECVVIGGGVRKPEELLEFFERVINLVHRHAPNAAIAFNSNPMDSADAALRWIRR